MVIVVFTKCDVLRNDCLAEACDDYCDTHQDEPPFDIYTIPGKTYPVVMEKMNELFDRRKQDKETQIRDLLKGAYKCVFVSRRGQFLTLFHIALYSRGITDQEAK